MLGIRGWSDVAGGTYVRRVWLEAGNGGEGPYGYSSAIDWAFELEAGDVVTDANGLSDTIVSVVDSVSHVIGKLSYDTGHIAAWDNGYATVTRTMKRRKTVALQGGVSTQSTDVQSVLTARAGSTIALGMTATSRWQAGAGWDAASTVLVTPSASGQGFTEVDEAVVGVKTLINVGSHAFQVDQPAGSNIRRTLTPGGIPFAVMPGRSCYLVRDTATDCWRAVPAGDPLASVPGLIKLHDASIASSLTLSVGDVTQWDDLSGNGYHDTVRGGANAPSYAGGGVVFDASNTEELIALGFNTDTYLGGIPFVVAIEWSGTLPKFGGSNGVPRFYLEETAGSYNTVNTITYSSAGAVRLWVHDGTSFSHRQDGVEVATAAEALSALTGNWRTRPGINGTLYRYAIYDASTWGGDFAANVAAIEAAMGV